MEAKAGLKLGIMREIMDPVFNNLLGFRVSLDERHGSHRFFSLSYTKLYSCNVLAIVLC